MAFSVTSEVKGEVAKIFLVGELDGSSAQIFKEEIEKLSPDGLKRLVLQMEELEYMASAGLRVLIFAKQKMTHIDLYVVGAQEMVLDTIEKTGFHHSVILQDQYVD
jgi:anti-sigma B factor antagonist